MVIECAPSRQATVELYATGPPENLTGNRVVELVLGHPPHCGLDGMRMMLSAVAAAQPHLVRERSARHAPEWNVLFPDTFPDAPPLATMAATCSERRLHAESEQAFRAITAASEVVVAAAAQRPLTVVVRNAGCLDLPTLRAVPHLGERAALHGAPLRIVLAELPDGPPDEPDPARAQAALMRWRLIEALAERLGHGVTRVSDPRPLPDVVTPRPGVSAEARWHDALDVAGTPVEVVTAALGVMRGAFFSTAHDHGVLAAHRLLAELDSAPGLDVGAVRDAFAGSELGGDPGSVGLDPSAVIDRDSLRSLAHRYLGMSHVFLLDYRTALRHLRIAAELGVPVVRARARLLAALLLIKRVGAVDEGFDQVSRGLADLAGDASAAAEVESAWLHNVKALGHVQRREPDAALAEEQRAIRLVGRRGDTDATHLKVNLISNVSVLREYAGQPRAAVRVWRQFSRHSQNWGDTFFKHHAYREGGLLVRAGSPDAAVPCFTTAYRLASAAGDTFYRTHIALELGRLLLDSEPDQAAEWYASAADHADAVGDPYLACLAVAGRALARDGGRLTSGDRRSALDRLAGSGSYPQPAARLGSALESGDDAAVLACLPTPGTKLNRPFHAVRLELSPLL